MPDRPLSEEILFGSPDRVVGIAPASWFHEMSRRVAALEAENARLRKVYEAAVRLESTDHAEWEDDHGEYVDALSALMAAVREARDG